MSILEKFSEMVKEDNEQVEGIISGNDLSKYEQDLNKEVEKLRNNPNDPMVIFKMNYPNVKEEDLIKDGCITDVKVDTVVKKAFCPKCGKELVSVNPLMLNPFTGEKIAKHECECGYKANLEYAYPRIAFIDKDGNEILAFSR